ncbi:MAG: alpha-1,6-glucosidase domain-containing protein [Anaerolineae bacterium]
MGAARLTDSFNWGYDPYHHGVPEGSYSTNPDGITRILEFRDMVSVLNQSGLRVVMDVVYNHTAASGQGNKSVLDKVVPGYYHRYDAVGALYMSSCCDDTATEYEMMEKLMIDTIVRFATAYKVDGFRFDLMNLHTRQNMLNLKTAVQAVDPTIYLYGEGWDFGSAKDKGLTTCPHCYAQKYNMTGAGIGLFNNIIHDAAHGGYSTDTVQIRRQGFINGLSYDWNGYSYANRYQSDLWAATDQLRSALCGSGTDWNGQGAPFTDDPQEAINYVEKHDNETLFDQNVFKLPNGDGSGNPGWIGSGIPTTSMADRVRSQNMGVSIVGLAQGVPFFQMGQDILRSKSLDRNSYDSGDWFNRVYWDKSNNNFGKGLPPAWDNNSRWGIMTPLLNNTALDPTTADMNFAAAHLREILRIRKSSPLFRLITEADINARVTHYHSDNAQDALIVMRLSDEVDPDLDSNWENILVFFNAHQISQSIVIPGANGFTLHPLHTNGVDDDPVIATATFNDATDTFTIPARTTAVFVSTQSLTPPTPPSTIDWVGLMWPHGGMSRSIDQGNFAPSGFDVYVQVYEDGVTPGSGQGAGIQCYLHWGKYGSAWTDLAMAYNTDIGNNDEYKATIPQATLNALGPGTYGFTAYCQKTGETGKNWVDIEKECTYLAQKGYTAVQVSPPNEHLVPTADQGGQPESDYPWWARYQPVTHDTSKFTSRSGTWAEFQSMVNTCNSLGVGIYVDAVINHMADIEVGSPPAGTAGTQYDSTAATRFYGTQYQADDFHTDCTISNYSDRYQVQRCKLSGLPDLHTGKSDVQTELRNYLQALINAGVKGFRIDGAKHIAAHEIAAILDGLTGDFYVFQEVIDAAGERVRDWEYTPNGDVTEFAYSYAIGAAFDDACTGSLSDLQNRFTQSDMLPSRFAQVFTDNHDNQRGHGLAPGQCIVDHRDGQEHVVANIFALAYPYGHLSVMSSYYWQSSSTDNTGDSKGPPSATSPYTTGSGGDTRPVYGPGQVAGDVPANCSATFEDGKWACEHRRTATANMVRFRWVTAGETVNNWQNIGGTPTDHIAFGLGSKGFVAINRTGSNATTTYATSMPEGTYCDITKYDFIPATGKCLTLGTTNDAPAGDLITVNSSGQIVNKALNSMDAFAIHVGARMATDYGSLPNSYGLPWHTEVTGQPILGNLWRTDDGVTLQSDTNWGDGTAAVDVTVTGANGCLSGWMDKDKNGSFDSGELIIDRAAITLGAQAVTVNLGGFTFPGTPSNYNFRFRLTPRDNDNGCTGGDAYPAGLLAVAGLGPQAPLGLPSPTGRANGGEVEDFNFQFGPLAVTLASFTATTSANGVALAWETVSEQNNADFNIYRAEAILPGNDFNGSAGPWTRLNPALIPAAAPGSSEGHAYTFTDATVQPGVTYWYLLEDVALDGTATQHPPIQVTVGEPNSIKLATLFAVKSLGITPYVVTTLVVVAIIALAAVGLRRRK